MKFQGPETMEFPTKIVLGFCRGVKHFEGKTFQGREVMGFPTKIVLGLLQRGKTFWRDEVPGPRGDGISN